MDLKTALTRFTNVHRELKPGINKTTKVNTEVKKPVYQYNRSANASIKAVLACSKGYDFQQGV